MVGLVLHLKQIKMQIWGKYNIIKIESRHKKRAGWRYRLLFFIIGEKTCHSNNSKERKVNKKMLLFYDFVKKMSIWLT